MSDDGDYGSWFHHDWVEDLIDVIRSYVVDPVDITFGQLRELVGAVTELDVAGGNAGKVTLRALEATIRSHNATFLPVSSVFGIVELCSKHSKAAQGRSSVLDSLTMNQLGAIMRPQFARLKLEDLVGVAKLASRQARHVDVFDQVTVELLTHSLSHSALRAFTLAELRTTLEGLATSGVFAKNEK